MSTNFPGSPLRWVLLHFPVLWEIDGETHTFSIWWSIQYDGNCMGKNHPYYGKSMSTNFPSLPHTKIFVVFSCTMRNWWESPCISHRTKNAIGWECNGKKAPILWEKWEYQFSRLFPIPWVLLHFPILWEVYGETHAFPIC